MNKLKRQRGEERGGRVEKGNVMLIKTAAEVMVVEILIPVY
jgi:hypothetical protein